MAGAAALSAISSTWILLQSPTFLSGFDFMRMHFFYKTFFRDALLAGRLPLWNPYAGLGRPFMADIETASLYPANLLVLPLGVAGGVAAMLYLHQTLAVYGGVRLGRYLGTSRGASWLLGGGLSLASPFTSRLAAGIVEGYFTLCWLPLIFWLGARLQDGWDRRGAAALAAAVALMILAGQPPLAFVVFVGLVLFLAFRIPWPGDPAAARQALGAHAGVALAILLGVGLAGAEILPFIDLVRQGNRPFNAPDFAVANGTPIASWLSLVVPTTIRFGPNWEYDLYCGLIPVLAALSGLLLWRERNVRALLGLGLVGALLAAGDRLPFLRWATHVIPGSAGVRIPSRYGILLGVSILGLAAMALSRRPRRPGPVVALGLAGASAVILWLEPYVVRNFGTADYYYSTHLGAAALAAVLLLLWHHRERWPGRAGSLAAALALFCGANWFWAYHLLAPVYSQYGFAMQDGALRREMGKLGLFRPGAAPPRVAYAAGGIRENAGMVQGFSTYNSYVAPSLARPWEYVHSAAGIAPSQMDFILLPGAIAGRAQLIDGANLAAYVDGSGAVVPIPSPDPRAYVAFEAATVASWREAEATMAARRDFHTRALVEAASAPAFEPAPGPHRGAAEVTAFAPEHIAILATADAPGVLVLAEAWYPGWSATVAGRPAAVFPVNGWMRGVAIPAGRTEVTLAFHSRLLLPGLGLTAASAGFLGLLLRRPRPGRQGGGPPG